ncbi:MAG TPA: hypothetical protein VGU43_02395 [Thermoplasmata archaeon]|nr:hypothetical protein [Thermoplasmata archaeon]
MPAPTRSRAPILCVAGLSAAGKSRFLSALVEAGIARSLAEPWTTLRPQPCLGVDRLRPLLALERGLLRQERRRFHRAERLAAGDTPVWLDAPPIGPLTYGRALCALLGLPWRPRAWMGPSPPRRGPELLRLADLVVYLRADALTTLRRALDRPRSSDAGHEAQHLVVGLLEERFWLGEFHRAFPDRLVEVDGGRPLASLVRDARGWTERAAELGSFGPAERARLAGLLSRPASLPARLLPRPGQGLKAGPGRTGR